MSVFRFKQFSVEHGGEVFKVGTDGLLLATWAAPGNVREILDIGTGSGIIALVAAQRFPSAHITAIDIRKAAFETAQANFSDSPWSNRLTALHISLAKFRPDKTFDHIFSNPPFFSNGTPPPDMARAMARHNQTLPPGELLKQAAGLLPDNGKFSCIYPAGMKEDILQLARQANLYPERMTAVRGTPGNAVKRWLFTFGKNATIKTGKDELILRNEDGSYSNDAASLFRNFLTIF